LEDITEEELKKAIQSKDCSPKDFLVLFKMLCAKKGMTLHVWEEIFHEQRLKQKLRQSGVSEDIVTDVVAHWIRAQLGNGSSEPGVYEDSCKPGYFLNFNMHNKLTCAVCPREPYRAFSIETGHITGKIEDIFVTVLCKGHFQRIEGNDVKLVEAVVDTIRQHKR
jgi:hypothetical protein